MALGDAGRSARFEAEDAAGPVRDLEAELRRAYARHIDHDDAVEVNRVWAVASVLRASRLSQSRWVRRSARPAT